MAGVQHRSASAIPNDSSRTLRTNRCGAVSAGQGHRVCRFSCSDVSSHRNARYASMDAPVHGVTHHLNRVQKEWDETDNSIHRRDDCGGDDRGGHDHRGMRGGGRDYRCIVLVGLGTGGSTDSDASSGSRAVAHGSGAGRECHGAKANAVSIPTRVPCRCDSSTPLTGHMWL